MLTIETTPEDRVPDADNFPASSAKLALMARYSIEITPKDLPALHEVKMDLPPGTAVSVTFLAGDDLEGGLKAAADARRLGFVPVPHLSARRLRSAFELEDYLSKLASQAHIDQVFVVAGDAAQPAGPFKDAAAIIGSGLLGKHGVRTVGIAGYPEGHPDFPAEVLWQAMQQKHSLIADLGQSCEITTQFGFDADTVLAWLRDLRERGFSSPVRLGVPGPASVKTLLRFATRCGVGASTKVLAKYGMSITRLLSTVGPDALVTEFVERLDPRVHGEVRLHLYPFGGLRHTVDWSRRFATV
jgi:methylenetetrahydrofolate reductase (NADPH)